jgi:hypothetical protein
MTVDVVLLVGGVALVILAAFLTVRPGVLKRIGYDRQISMRISWWPSRLKFVEPPIQIVVLVVGLLWILLTILALLR